MKPSYIPRAVYSEFDRKLVPGKVLVLLGSRRVGKTEFVRNYTENNPGAKFLMLNGDDMSDIQLLTERRAEHYKGLLIGVDILFVDEAQNVPEVGKALKLIVDSLPEIRVIATGSSIFDLNNKMGEPLVGRKNTMHLFPLAQVEFSKLENYKETLANLETRLIYGAYPELEKYERWEDKREYLEEIMNSHLLKDILAFQGIRNSAKIFDLLKLIALQTGREVSVQELGNKLAVSKNTVSRYLDLLSKVFIVFRLDGFSRNLRKEITKTKKWYFYDNGIRNAVIQNFNRISERTDMGQLWENYLVSERIKKQHYGRQFARNYFWRTYDQQEIDWLEERDQKLSAFEFKWSKRKRVKVPAAFRNAYPEAEFTVINRENYLDFIT